MALVLRTIYNSYHYYFYTTKDPRSEGWFLVQTPPLAITSILIGYVILIKHGPKLMEKREPFELKYIMMLYNLFQVVSNFILGVYGGYFFFVKHSFSFRCANVNFTTDEYGMMELKVVYWYFLLKVLDLVDSLFIVLKKKNSHLSFLHCYHHFFMVVGTYIAVRWIPGGHGLLLGFVNLFVHAFMYFYYFLNAVKPELKQSLWWKKHITQIQMFQFAFLDIAFFYATFFDCGYPKFWLWVLVIQNTFMFALFADFYRRAYFKKAKTH